MDALIALGTAFVLGALHALEVDHMVAVTAFVADRPALARAAAFGARWGAGHGLAVLAAGGVLLASGLRWPERFDAWGEAAVGLMLLTVGLWAFRRARKLHVHSVEEHGGHGHMHAHGGGDAHQHGHGAGMGGEGTSREPRTGDREPHPAARAPHRHGRGITAVGLVHGLAGSSAAVALVPVTLMDRPLAGVLYLASFGVGTMVAMGGFAVAAAGAMRGAGARSVAWARRMGALSGVGAMAVGVWWTVRALGG